MLTSKGAAKVLDFGLAQTAASTKLTRMGSTLGTIAYMSPEQARGEQVDHRSDLYSLGTVLYEMVAGRLPFGGEYEQAIVYSILNAEPEPLTALRTGVPMELERIVMKLLAKEAGRRYASAADLIVDLGNLDLRGGSGSMRTTMMSTGYYQMSETAAGGASSGKPFTARMVAAAAVVTLCVAAAFALGVWWSEPPASQGAPKRILQTMALAGDVASVDISDQGDKLAIAMDSIHVVELATGKMTSYDVPGAYVHLAFSPNGSEILVTTAEGLLRLSLQTGAVIDLGKTAEGGPRGEWVTNDYIMYEEQTSVFGRSLNEPSGRQLIELDTLSGMFDLDYPSILPDGKTIMATAQYQSNQGDRIGFWDMKSGRLRKILEVEGTRAHYVEPGYLIFNTEARVMAVPFDVNALEQTGPIVQIDAPVQAEGMSISKEGTLVHVGIRAGIASGSGPSTPVIGGFGRDNELQPAEFPPDRYRNAAIHPSGAFAAVAVEQESTDRGLRNSDIWILDFETGSRRVLTSGGRSGSPAWSPSGDSLYYVDTTNNNNSKLMVMSANGRGGSRIVFEAALPYIVDLDVSPDGAWVAMVGGIPPTIDAWSSIIIVDPSSGAIHPRWQSDSGLITSRLPTPNGNPRHLSFSPDSEYLAYEDQGAIYVQSMEDLNSVPVMVWETGMTLPKWSVDGTVLHAVRLGLGRDAMDVQTSPVFRVLGRQPLSGMPGWFSTSIFDVFPDGERFLTGFPSTNEYLAEQPLAKPLSVQYILNVTGLLEE
jgi:hypothetical protein